MRKVLMQAHVIDENGATEPGQIITIHDGAAERYVKNGWGVFVVEEKTEEAASGTIEASEDGLPTHETATIKRGRGRPRNVVV